MRKRDALGLSLGPVFLRLILAITFIWAGAGKFLMEIPVSPPPPAQVQNTPNGETPDAGTSNSTAPTEASPTTQKAYHAIAGLITHAANPGFDSNGDELRPIWPAQLAQGHWPNTLALTASLSELIAGFLILIGLFTRFSSLVTLGIMAVAIWLTQIGPAIQTGDALLGFLPNRGAFDLDAAGMSVWFTLLWQFSLLCISAALMFLGAGTLSLDRLVFGGPSRANRSKSRETKESTT